MEKLLARWLINAIAIGIAVWLVDGIEAGGLKTILVVAIIFGLVNALIRPILKVLTCPLVILTLGLFIFVINGLMLWLTSAIANSLGLDFQVTGIVPAIIGAVIITLVSLLLSIFIRDED